MATDVRRLKEGTFYIFTRSDQPDVINLLRKEGESEYYVVKCNHARSYNNTGPYDCEDDEAVEEGNNLILEGYTQEQAETLWRLMAGV